MSDIRDVLSGSVPELCLMAMKRKITTVDVLLSIILVFSLFFASPYVMRQFVDLKNPLDIAWTISGDVVILAAGVLFLYALDRLLNRFL